MIAIFAPVPSPQPLLTDMSDRERWIIYPLLFLALGAALRDKLIDRTTTKSLVCQELLVMDEQPMGGEPVLLARIGPGNQTNSKSASKGHFMLSGDIALSGEMTVNGDFKVVDRDPMTQSGARSLVAIRRAVFGANAVPGGSVEVNGQVSVNGAINAAVYAYNGQRILPMLRGVPGAPIPAELLQTIPEALRNSTHSNAPSVELPQSSKSQPQAAPSAGASETPPATPVQPTDEPAADEPKAND
jgi:hypothetical protein